MCPTAVWPVVADSESRPLRRSPELQSRNPNAGWAPTSSIVTVTSDGSPSRTPGRGLTIRTVKVSSSWSSSSYVWVVVVPTVSLRPIQTLYSVG